MKITLEFESDEEFSKLNPALKRLGVTNKEDIETVLSEHLLEALQSPYLRVALRRKQLSKGKVKS